MKRRDFMLDRAVQALPGKLVKRADLEGKIGVIDEHIDGRELLPNRLSHRLDLSRLRDVRLEDHALPACFFHFLQNFQGALTVLVIIDDDGRSPLSQPLGSRRSYPPARPCDQSDFCPQRLNSFWLRHRSAGKPSDGDGVFRRPFFVLGRVLLEGEELHPDIGRAISV